MNESSEDRVPEQPHAEWGRPRFPARRVAGRRIIARRAADVLAYVPHALGEWPAESLVAVTLCGVQVGATLCLDLPPESVGTACRDYAELLRDYLAYDGMADGVFLAFYGGEAWTESPEHPPWEELLHEIGEILVEAGVFVRDAWLVGPEYWRSMLCGDSGCCPMPGEPVDEIRSSALGAELVFRGSSYAEVNPPPALELAELSPGLLRLLVARFQEANGGWRSVSMFAEALAAWEECLAGRPADAARRALLLSSLSSSTMRDAVLAAAAYGSRVAWRANVALGLLDDEESTSTGPTVAAPGGLAVGRAGVLRARWEASGEGDDSVEVFGRAVLGDGSERPDWARIERLRRLLDEWGRNDGQEDRAVVFTMLGWVEWVQGQNSAAARHLGRALCIAPAYRFAVLLRELVLRGEKAAWVKDERLAWRTARRAA